jgi:glutaredoxin
MWHLLFIVLSIIPTSTSYDTSVRSHNRKCIKWQSHHITNTPISQPDHQPWKQNRNNSNSPYICKINTKIGTYSGNATDNCNIQHPQAANSDNNNIFEIGYIHNDCLVYWHEQAFNALPLPMMTHYTKTPHSFDIGICMDQNNRLGIVHSDGPNYALCFLSQDIDISVAINTDGTEGNTQPTPGLAGGYRILGAYNQSSPYVPTLSLPTDTTATDMLLRHNAIMKTIEKLVLVHINIQDRFNFLQVTNTSLDTLLQYMHASSTTLNLHGHGGACVLRFLTADRYIHDLKGNRLGLHVFRCLLARRVTDQRRIDQGAAKHPDFQQFQKQGYLMKDYSQMNNNDLMKVLRMVSGYGDLDIPDLVWTLREVIGNKHDNNLDLHVDTFAPTWKIWLYAEDITLKHGPLTYVQGSHMPNVEKLSFLYRASIDPTETGASSYGSFRMGRYGMVHSTLLEKNASIFTDKKNRTHWNETTGFVPDSEGVWQCDHCVADERTYGFRPRIGIVGSKMTLVVADVSGLHCRGLSMDGQIRRTFILHGHGNDGGLPRVNPFTYVEGVSGLHT